jgi:hypothetical protein
MFRVIAGIAIITTMCVLSPVRESRNDSGSTGAWPPASLSASLDVLTGVAGGATRINAADAGREAVGAALAPGAREAASAELENVRRVIIPNPAVPVDMPPLRR